MDQAPGAAQILLLRKVMDNSGQQTAAMLASLPSAVPPRARPGELLL